MASGLVVQAIFLHAEGVRKSCRYRQDGQYPAEVHVGQRPHQAASHKSACQGADAPVDEPATETAVDKGLLKPLVKWISYIHYTPKKALMTTDTNTRKRQDPPHDISSLLMSWSPAFHLM